ncbi:hypothetical protein VMCG_01760 [Cytospora schulzeri]|uniref:Uncharacterized protein n=1 Tax=Cytospora schulzeri TaxID=448051 RepID=A0A423X3Q9_9PEZI|nr:hypothetical protein VMCG_01760 [Valsa malicola]
MEARSSTTTETASVLRSLRLHGRDEKNRFDNSRIGMNGRLDTLQAAVLLRKLGILADEIKARQYVASRYARPLKRHNLDGTLPWCHPAVVPRGDVVSAWAEYTVLQANLNALGSRHA